MSNEIRSIVGELLDRDVIIYVVNGALKTRSVKSSLTPYVIDLIKSNKNELINFLVNKEQLDSAVRIHSMPRNKNGYELSYSQHRLWLIDQINEGSTQYNISAVLRFSGALDVGALKNALTDVVNRHESLRTVFVDSGEGPLQVIQERSIFDLPVFDLSDQTATEKTSQLDQRIVDEEKKCFVLSRDLMLRANLVKLSEGEHILLVTMHHIASDGWSAGILIKEMSHLYQSYLESRVNPLPSLEIQYADYAHWQRQWLQGDILDKQVDYWKEKLSNLPVVHSLPLDNARPQKQSFRGDNVSADLNKVSLDSLNSLCVQQGATLFMGLHSAFSILLARYSGEFDIVMGTPIANREQAEVMDLIGFFVNTLVLRSDMSGNPSFVELLKQSKQTALEAYAHQQVPFEKLVEVLQPERSLRHGPLFQIMLVLQNNEQSTLELPGLTLSHEPKKYFQSKFDLSLNAVETDGGLALEWEFNTDIFERTTIERMADSFILLVDNLLKNPQENVFTVDFLNKGERNQQFLGWNDTQVDYSGECCIQELFEKQAHKQPDAIAVVCDNIELSYRELNERSNQLAHYLHAQGVQPHTLVAVCMERSPDLVIALIAILKAGAAYVPLDPNYPQDRLEYMLKNCEAPTFITQSMKGDLNSTSVRKRIYLDAVREDISNCPTCNLASHNARGDLVYLIYTSGSTGKPKGIEVLHGGVSNLVHWYAKEYTFSSRDNFLIVSAIGFDLTQKNIWTPLSVGGTIILPSADSFDVDYLLALSKKTFPTVINCAPSAFNSLLVGSDNWVEFSHINTVLLGGEQLHRDQVDRWRKKIPSSVRIVNMYGPSEATDIVTRYNVNNMNRQKIAIGKPIQNVKIYVCAVDLSLCPIGVVGELYVGGSGVARGYCNNPELTAEKFIQNPFSSDSKDRLYKTGDLVRWLPSGDLDYVGRIDNQVKIRGFRIELGEIENTLLEQTSIAEVVVVVRKESDDQRLVAYIVTAKNPTDSELFGRVQDERIDDWREHLRQTLPVYMLPSAFVVLDALPLTPNGKVDRKALPAPDMSQMQTVYISPIRETEKSLCGIWQNVLGLKKIGVTDNFFHLGGHSLLATRLVSQVNRALNVDLPLKTIFESNTVRALAMAIDQLELSSAYPAIEYTPRTKPLLLSYAQQRLWFIDQFSHGSTQYNMPAALRLSGFLDVLALQNTLNTLVDRHETLRTNFVDTGEGPRQKVQSVSRVKLVIIDLSHLDSTTQDQKTQQYIMDEANEDFNLSADLMLRVKLLILSECEHILLATMHHIASDGWSMGILIKELSQLYMAYVEGRENPLPSLAIQYADYAHWQRQWLQGEVLDKQVDYWKQQLSNLPVVHNLPIDKARPKQQSFAGASYRAQLGKTSSEGLNALCREQGATLFMGLHAALSVLLAHYSGESDIVVGSPIANREQLEVADLIGLFVNTLVLRSDVSDELSFIDLLQQCQRTALDAYAHQQVPFEQLVEVLQPQRSLSHSPLFQIMLVLQNNEQSTLELPGLTLTAMLQEHVSAKFDLTLNVVEMDEGLALEWEYNTDLFEQPTIERMAANFVLLVDNLLAEPHTNIATINFLNESERYRQMVVWNDTTKGYPHESCIHELFEAQVNNNSDAIAVVFEEQQLTYGELNYKANQLAHYLVKEKNVRPDTLVGLCLDRSLDLVVSLFGILKAGGAYVPLDPDYPQARLAYMLEDAALDTVVTNREVLARTPITSAQALCLNDVDSQKKICSQPYENLAPSHLDLRSNHLAYVIYTSGSTGNPKGVKIIHRAVVNFLYAFKHRLNIGSDDCWLAVTPISFDIAVLELYLPLLSNSKVVIASSAAVQDGSSLAALMRDSGTTVMQATPATWTILYHQNDMPSLRHALVGGDSFPLSLARYMRPKMESLFNLYGPTEATVWATIMALPKGIDRMLIGKPMDNTVSYVVSNQLKPVPIGVPGELLIGGDCLARGYLNRSELTAEKFIRNPFSDAPTDRLYKTGDLVRWLPDGNLEFLGRIDDQVKIRGFRIELGEIENTLLKYNGIKSAVVVAREDNGDKRLVAYIVLSHDAIERVEIEMDEGSEAEIVRHYMEQWRNHLSQTLPEYMLPSAFVVLEALPLTPNGKIDRKALPSPDMNQLQDSYLEPRTSTEKVLCEIWQEILGLEQVGVNDNFFHLGGHSLLATRLVSQVNRALTVELSLKTLFESNTVMALAIAVEGLDSSSAYPPIKCASRTEPLLLSHAQQRLWFIDQMVPGSTQYNMPAALRLSGILNVAALQNSLSTLLDRHESLRTIFVDTEEGPRQQIQPLSYIALAYIDLSQLDAAAQGEKIQQNSVDEANGAFDLSADLMLRARLLKLSEGEHILLMTMHHIASDGWSMGILVNELSQLYLAYAQGRENPLQALTIQYADYAHWQRQWLQGDVLDKQVDYWKKQLSNLPLVHNFPLDNSRPQRQTFVGASVSAQLCKANFERLHALCLEQGATVFMGLHAILSVLLARYSGESDIVMGSPIANREQTEVADLIGFFVNTLVLRSDVSENISFIDLLQQCKRTALDAYAHQQVPFEQLVEVLQPERSLSHSPLFQIMLVLQNNEKITLELPGLTLSSVDHGDVQAKFDLTLNVAEVDQGLSLVWEYNTDLFEPSTIKRMAEHFTLLVNKLLTTPHENVHSINFLTESERHQQLVAWNDTQTDYPHDCCIHELFEAQAKNNPDAIALVLDEQTLSYAELNKKSNQLAHYLVSEKYIQPDTLVGICLDRSLDLIISILGILKSGGAYVPLDPDYPAARLTYLLEDAGLKTVITNRDVLARTPINSTQALCWDDEDSQRKICAQSHDNLEPASITLMPSHLAYVIYTSGSTGQPKGVTVEHANVISLVVNVEYVSLSRDTIMLQNSPISFDAATFEVWGALLNGGTLVIQPERLLEMTKLGGILKDNNINTAWMTSGLFDQFTSAYTGALPELKDLLVGGDIVNKRSVEKIQSINPSLRVINGYGPTENTTFSCSYLIHQDGDEQSSIPVGRPISNRHAYVLDANVNAGCLMPLGAVGELYLGGAGVARGYLNRPELTAEKFIQNPFSDDPSDRLYKTGDLVRWLPDGNLQFTGRIDNQVKIRGFRIELGEIEYTLLSHSGIKEAVVIAREDNGYKRLVAYVITDQEGTENESIASTQLAAWRDHLNQALPDYMLPSAFVVLKTLPLTRNGKVDRKALPAPDMSQLQDTYVAPETETEKRLCEIWQDILGLKQVGVSDNFFRLGGHSLLATRLVSNIEGQWNVMVPLRIIFEKPSVESLAIFIDKQQEHGHSRLPAIQARLADEIIPLSLIQQSYWFLYQLEGGGSLYNVPFTIRLSGVLNIPALEKSLHSLICRHENLRTRVLENASGPVQTIDLFSSGSLRVIQTNETDVLVLIEEHTKKAFVLNKESAFRVSLYCVGSNDYIFSMVSHHAVMDGWSMDILFREITQLYDAFCLGKDSPLAPLSVQYGDYAVWQKKHIMGERYDQQCAYWQEKLNGLAPLLNLPTDYVRPPAQSYRGDRCLIALSPALSKTLGAYAEAQGVTLFHVLISGMAVLISRYARTTDIPLGTAIANRPQQVLENVIGCFANTVVLRCDVQRDHDFTTLVQQVKDTALDAFSHSDVPFDGVVKAVQPERSLGVPPIFQVMFRLHNQARGEGLEFQGLKSKPFSGEKRQTVELDLNISLVETPTGIQGEFAYATDLFCAETIERFIRHYIALLTEAMKAPEKPLYSLALLSSEEQQQLTHWNDTAQAYPDEECIHALFEASAARLPKKIAYVCGDVEYSYQELNVEVNKIAHWLRSQGVGPDTRVGVCVGRSVWMGISLLAVLKSGGTYVPFDPNYPTERLGHMLAAVQPTLILSEQSVMDRLPKTAARIICFDRDRQLWKECKKTNPVEVPQAEHPAYILFTSGTTGVPKGILVAHKSLRNMPLAHEHWQLLDQEARVLQFASFSFAVSIWGSFMAWVAGSTLYQVTDDESLTGEQLYQLLNRERITTVTWPVSLLSILPLDKMPRSLSTIVSSAEPCNDDVVKRWTERDCRFLNVYGNTEVAVGSTLYEYKQHGQKLTIGRAFPNTQMYLLDEYLQPVPVGVVAEIVTGGVGVAIGYINQPEETAKKFIQSPFSTDANTRLYKTGDLGRYLPNGEIEFIGREDFQVSVRGYRIELNEVETILRQHENIAEVAVGVHASKDGFDHLVCFFVAKDSGEIPSNTELSEHVKNQLPSYMVPSLFVVLDAMPLTPNRKLDRLALSLPDTLLLQSENYLSPNTEIEKALCKIWQEALGLERVGLSDNFFQIGGHSLLALRLVGNINQVYGRQFPVTALFNSPSVAEFSKLVEASDSIDVSESCLRLMKESDSNKSSLFIVPGLGGSLLNLFSLSDELSAMGDVYGLQAVGLEDGAEPLDSVEEIAQTNIRAIQSVQADGHYTLIGHSFGGWIVFEMARQLKSQGQNVSIMLLDSPPPIKKINDQKLKYAQGKNLDEVDMMVAQLMGGASDNNVGLSLIEHELKERIQRVARVQAAIIYSPDISLGDVDALYFRAWDQQERYSDDAFLWSKLMAQEIVYQDVEYDHFGMLERNAAKELLKAMRSNFKVWRQYDNQGVKL